MPFLFCVILTFSLPLAISANVIEGQECDVNHGEIYVGGKQGLPNYAACKQACLDKDDCQSVTFYPNGGCGLFSTKCVATRAAAGARSEVVKELGGLYGLECDAGQGESYLSGKEGVANFAACKKMCQDNAECQSITFYHHGGCSLFRSKCENTKASPGARSELVNELQRTGMRRGRRRDLSDGEHTS